MSALADALSAVASILGSADRQWALVGALAVSARTEPRFTRDVDVAVVVADDADAEAVVRQFRGQGCSVFSIVEQAATKRLATARCAQRPSTIRDYATMRTINADKVLLIATLLLVAAKASAADLRISDCRGPELPM